MSVPGIWPKFWGCVFGIWVTRWPRSWRLHLHLCTDNYINVDYAYDDDDDDYAVCTGE